jgi:hypothetical protein
MHNATLNGPQLLILTYRIVFSIAICRMQRLEGVQQTASEKANGCGEAATCGQQLAKL